jgi:hypothetical protein
MSVIKVNNITNRDGTSGPVIAGIATVSTTSHLVVPTGNTGQKVPLAPDPFINNLVLALPFNSESVFDDVSPRGKGTGKISGSIGSTTSSLPFGISGLTTTSPGITTFSKYYGSSCYFDGDVDCLTYGSNSEFAYGVDDFTIEAWIYWTSTATSVGGQRLFLQGVSGATEIGINYNSTKFDIDINNATRFSYNYSLSAGQWYHIALIRRFSNTYELFVNGISQGTNIYTYSQNANNFIVGGLDWASGSGGYGLRGYMQDVRIYKSLAKYTSNFTPPNQIAL